MPAQRHNYAELARWIVETGCEHISKKAHGRKRKRPDWGREFLIDAARTAQSNLATHPEFAFTLADFAALTEALREFTRKTEIASTGAISIDTPDLSEDPAEHLNKMRELLCGVLSEAATHCAGAAFEKVGESVAQAWKAINESKQDTRALCDFRRQLVDAYVAEFKRNYSDSRASLN